MSLAGWRNAKHVLFSGLGNRDLKIIIKTNGGEAESKDFRIANK